MSHPGTFPARPRPHFQDPLHFKESPAPALGTSRATVDTSKSNKDRLTRARHRPVPGFERRILDDDGDPRIVAGEQRSRAVLIDVQAPDFRGPMTGNHKDGHDQSFQVPPNAMQASHT